MSIPPLHVFWLCGAPGAGKSVAAWGLFEELAAAGRPVAYVDIDQLGMLYPAAEDDPERHLLKCAALDALVPGYAAAGARVLVVSGVVDTRPVLTSNADLTLCLLSPDPGALRERVLARGWAVTDAERAVSESAVLRDAEFVDLAVETAGMSVAATIAQLRRLVGDVRPVARRPWASMLASDADVGVVVVTGPRAVGSSTIGFGLAMRYWSADRRAGFIDLQQLGFLSTGGRPATDLGLSVAQVTAMHGVMAARGAERLVVSGHLGAADRDALRTSLPAASVTVVRLRADEDALREHVRTRTSGSDARLAGDDLLAADPAYQDAVVASALAEQAALDASAVDDAVLDVSGRTPAEVITELQELSSPAGLTPGD
jgi:broad-specificity NMP kinase